MALKVSSLDWKALLEASGMGRPAKMWWLKTTEDEMQATEMLKQAGYDVGPDSQDVPIVAVPFKLGDVVRLKSGGPDMTVCDFWPNGLGVHWFCGLEPHTETFPAECLVLAKTDDV